MTTVPTNKVIYEYNPNSTNRYEIKFEYDDPSQIYVRYWDETTNEYVYYNRETDWELDGIDTLVWITLTPLNDPFEIIRGTDITEGYGEHLFSRFISGSAIKASDLNGNLERLRQKIEEVDGDTDSLADQIQDWEDKLEDIGWDQIRESDKITEAEMKKRQTYSKWTDDRVATAGAAKRYFENLYQEVQPDSTEVWEKGKIWYQRYTTAADKEVQNLWMYNGENWDLIQQNEVIPNPFFPESIIYVDPQGDDNNPGRKPDEAYRTIKAAVADANEPSPGVTSTVQTAAYSRTTGTVNITTTAPHGLSSGQTVTISPMVWRCPATDDMAEGEAQYPKVDKKFRVAAVASPNIFRIFVGYNDKIHNYVSGGTVVPRDAKRGDGYTILCAPGVYSEKFPIVVEAKNLAIIGSSLRNTYIHPDISGESPIGKQGEVDIYPTELKTMFELDSGSYLTGFTFAGLKSLGIRGGSGSIDPDDTYGLPSQQGWVATHRAGSFITKSPYIQNCTHFSDLQTDNSAFDPNFLAGEGGDTTSGPAGGGMLVDGERVDPSSPLRSFVVDSFTQISLGGPGVLCTNNGYSQLVSFFGTFCHYHAKSMNGGQLNLSNCTTDFGRYGLIADGKSKVPIFSGALYQSAAKGSKFIKVHNFQRGTQWEPPRAMTPSDHMVVDIDGVLYPILSSNYDQSTDSFNVEIFCPLSADAQYDNGGLVNAADPPETVRFYLQSYISTGGHTFEYVGSGTDYTAHPDFGGIPIEINQVKELGGENGDIANGRLRDVNRGRVWQSSTDENGVFQVGQTFRVNQKTGVIQYLEEAVDARFRLREDLDMLGYKIFTSFPDQDIQIEPSGSGNIVLGSKDFDTQNRRVDPAYIEAPIMEQLPANFGGILTEDLNNASPALTQNDVGYDADEIPLSGLLGELAFTDTPPSVGITKLSPEPNEIKFELSGTDLIIKVGKPDGTILTHTLALT